MAFTVAIDAGHGGFDQGAMYGVREEKTDNLHLAQRVGNMLNENGVGVYYTRPIDEFISPSERAKLVNDSNADVLVSLHRNTSATPNTYNGVESIISNSNGISEELANNVQMELENLGFKNLGISAQNDPLISNAQVPGVLVKVGFINSDADNEIFDLQQEQVAMAIANGILTTLQHFGQNKPNLYRVQIGAFRNENNARAQAYKAFLQGYEVIIELIDGLFVVLVGELYDLDQAVMLERVLRTQGYDTLITMNTPSLEEEEEMME